MIDFQPDSFQANPSKTAATPSGSYLSAIPQKPSPLPSIPETPRLLIVADDPNLRGYLLNLLSPLYLIDSADAKDALQRLQCREPHLVMCALSLSEGGLDLIKRFKGDTNGESIPFIFVSLADNSAQRTAAIHAGADDFLCGPLLGREVIARLQTHLELVRLRQTVRCLTKSVDEANTASTLKNTFLANMSHEIRTPMTAVLGFAEVLRDPTLSEAERFEAVSRIEQSGRNLLRIIDDILDISKIEAGRLQIEKIHFSPSALVDEIVSMLNMQACAKGLYLNVAVDENLPKQIVSDPTRLRQILVNLVGNAIKFTPAGGVLLKVTTKALSEPCHFNLAFEVIDTGIGIDPSHRDHLFQPFVQADESITRKFGGSGLGLIVSKRLAEHLGGNLELLESEPGQGSRFLLSISCESHENTLEEIEAEARARDVIKGANKLSHELEGVHILIAEDVIENQTLFKFHLERSGAMVDVADNGDQALRKLQHKNYDIILMDVQMPVMDGLEATRLLRQRGYTKPILALTAHAMTNEMGLCQEAGCDDHITKPIGRYQLIERIKRYLH